MPRNMSFSMTTEQIRKGTKTVTRRMGWWNLKPGEIVNACVKCMGLKKGEKIEMIRQIRVVSTRGEMLCNVTRDDIIREGFPEKGRGDFIVFFMRGHKQCKGDPRATVNRIEFEYL